MGNCITTDTIIHSEEYRRRGAASKSTAGGGAKKHAPSAGGDNAAKRGGSSKFDVPRGDASCNSRSSGDPEAFRALMREGQQQQQQRSGAISVTSIASATSTTVSGFDKHFGHAPSVSPPSSPVPSRSDDGRGSWHDRQTTGLELVVPEEAEDADQKREHRDEGAGSDGNEPAPVPKTLSTKRSNDVDEAATDASDRPLIFALMTSGRRVIRGAMEDISRSLDAGDVDGASQKFMDLDRWKSFYAMMEDGNGFIHHETNTIATTPKGMLLIINDEFNSLIEDDTNYDADLDEFEVLEEMMRSEFSSNVLDTTRIKETWKQLHEESKTIYRSNSDIQIPQLDSISEVAREDLGIVAGGRPSDEQETPDHDEHSDFRFFIQYANNILEQNAKPSESVQVFDFANWICLDPTTWTVVEGSIKETMPADHFEEVRKALYPLN
mmetsp:Transcript_5209/g.15213  ORF Transcript_5209/g.15213 Transcript_5209/m.15213 type:complete len:438 (+) Transcript_5209:199-1512(+)|eukprot:CAMPEP_0119571918 /NCGR_PEP_ID=MMETSP1352-20130426/44360_1 /TAXON_ID=265584 /ORGANISM="Stauroneis constricta, Strain CCMP1120" /LENGTH=437 /DNA_ID=CAMNT_0007621601 /DNA_START=139 /DNA_END=1452 /DNA_ORIENTATION=+